MEILCYTREPEEEKIYSPKLAYSMHLAYREDKGDFSPFHHNEGVLYARGISGKDCRITARCLRNPWIFMTGDGRFGVAAVRTDGEGK